MAFSMCQEQNCDADVRPAELNQRILKAIEKIRIKQLTIAHGLGQNFVVDLYLVGLQ